MQQKLWGRKCSIKQDTLKKQAICNFKSFQAKVSVNGIRDRKNPTHHIISSIGNQHYPSGKRDLHVNVSIKHFIHLTRSDIASFCMLYSTSVRHFDTHRHIFHGCVLLLPPFYFACNSNPACYVYGVLGWIAIVGVFTY